MSLSNFRKRNAEPQEPERDPSRCIANGCPCRGSVSHDGSRFMCSAHADVPADRWPMLSERLRDHVWLIEFTDEMQKMDRQHGDWRGFALQFWANSDQECAPVEGENAIPYQLRMRSELMFRCGLMTKRPTPLLPQQQPAKGRFGNAGGLAGGRS